VTWGINQSNCLKRRTGVQWKAGWKTKATAQKTLVGLCWKCFSDDKRY